MNATDYLPPPPATDVLQGVTRLTHWGVIRAEGEDAAKFLHGQLSQDFALLGLEQARLAAYCSPQGRMLASVLGFKRSATDILLVCQADLLAATLKRLSMFVMRAKARLSDASAEFALFGLAGAATLAPHHAPWSLRTHEDAHVIDLYPALGVPRQLCIAPAHAVAPAGQALDLAIWQWGEVHSGVASLSAVVSGHYVPQMLNYESVGGVNFKKGCYPGQEVVARSQYRGTLKRRAFVVHANIALRAGDELFDAADDSQPVGSIAQAAPAPGGGCDAIAVLQINAAQTAHLRLAQAPDAEIRQFALPYALLDDV